MRVITKSTVTGYITRFRHRRVAKHLRIQSKMGVSGKFLFLFIAIIAFQGIYAWPHFYFWKWKNLGYEINKASDDAEKDVRKDLLNVKNNMWKDTNKLIMKMRSNEDAVNCMVQTQQKYLTDVDNISVTAMECITDVRDEGNSIEDEEYNPKELNAMKNAMKNNVKKCRNTAKDNFKKSQKEFSAELVTCMDGHRFVAHNRDDDDDISRSL